MSELLIRALLTLALGCLLSLPLISVREVGRGFFTLWSAIIGVLGTLGLALRRGGVAGGEGWLADPASLLLLAALVLTLVFWACLRLGAPRAASALLIAAALSGGAALLSIAIEPAGPTGRAQAASLQGPRDSASGAAAGASSRTEPGEDAVGGGPALPGEPTDRGSGPARALARVSNALLSALAVGLVTVAMVLGHWYLVQLKLPIAPLRRACNALLVILVARLAVSAWGLVRDGGLARILQPAPEPVPWILLVYSQRVLFGFGGSIVLAIMIRKTVALRATMSATGLLYIAILFVWVGEFLSLYLDRLTGGELVV